MIFLGYMHAQVPNLPETLSEKIDALAGSAVDGNEVKKYLLELGPEVVPIITRKLEESLAEGSTPVGTKAFAMLDMPPEDQKRANHQMGLAWLQSTALQSMSLDPQTRIEAQQVIYGTLKSPYLIARKTAIYAAADSGGKGAVDQIVPLLDDFDMFNRANAAQVLAKIGDETTAMKIANVLERRRVGLTDDEVSKDVSFQHGYFAVEKLRRKTVEGTPTSVPNVADKQSFTQTPSAPAAEEKTSYPIIPVLFLGVLIAGVIVFLFYRKNP